MHLHLSIDIPTNRDSLFAAKISTTMFGTLESNYIALNPESRTEHDIELTPVISQLASKSTPERAYIFVAFQMRQPASLADLTAYVNDRHPALEKHGGKILASSLTERKGTWQYDGIELIEFPETGTVQQLMADPDYKQRTAQSSQAFNGEFAMAILTSILD